MRTATLERATSETKVAVTVDLDGSGRYDVATGIGFLHTTEDAGIVIGQAFAQALGERRGIRRYGQALSAMDETLVRVVVDASNRPYLIWKVRFNQPKLGELDTEMVKEWFQAFAQNAGLTLHVETLYGENSHHICEACFKGLARALREAVEIDPRKEGAVPSTKGTL